MTETEIQNKICNYLALKGYFFWRTQSQGTYDAKSNSYRKRGVFELNGVGDITLILPPNGRMVSIEVKTAIGKMSDAQKAFKERLERNGGIYILARCVDDVTRHLDQLDCHQDSSHDQVEIGVR